MKIFRVFVKSFSYVRYSKRKPRPQSKPKVAGQKYIALAAYQKLHMEKAATNTSVKMVFHSNVKHIWLQTSPTEVKVYQADGVCPVCSVVEGLQISVKEIFTRQLQR